MKKTLSLILTAALLVAMCVPVFAAGPDGQTSSGQVTDNSSHTSEVPVTATLETGYIVSLPAVIALGYDAELMSWTNEYTVNVTGVLGADTDKVTVVPASSFTMTNTTDSKTTQAKVTQEFQTWMNVGSKYNHILQMGDDANGQIKVNFPSAGTYTGNLTFTYQKVIAD